MSDCRRALALTSVTTVSTRALFLSTGPSFAGNRCYAGCAPFRGLPAIRR